MNLYVNYGLWVTMMSQGRFIRSNKHIILVKVLIIEEAMHVGGRGVWEISIFSCQFYWESKTAVKLFCKKPQTFSTFSVQ